MEAVLKEAVEVFGRLLEESGRLILDAHIPKPGTYRLIEMRDDGWRIIKTLDLYYDRKKQEMVGQNDAMYPLIRELDYNSKLIAMNKPIDPKKVIHSNHYLSLAVKKNSISEGKLSEEVLEKYYEILGNPIQKYEKKRKAKSLYEEVEQRIGQPDLDILNEIKNYVLTHEIWEEIDLTSKDYVKVFFVFPDKKKTKEYYEKENERYLIPNIYTSNDFNEEEAEGIVGLPNNNMGMNSKKPFLENKTRKVKMPYLLNQDDVLLQAKFFDYLMGQVSQGRINIYIDMDEEAPEIRSYSDLEAPEDMIGGYYIKCQKGRNEAEIISGAVVSGYSSDLDTIFKIKNYMEILDDIMEKYPISKYVKTSMEQLWQLKDIIDDIFFDGRLKYNFRTEARDMNINDSILKRCILENRDTLAMWFWQGEKSQVEMVFDKFSLELIKNSIRKERRLLAQYQFNLRWSLLEYLNPKRKMGAMMIDCRQILREHINSNVDTEWDFSSDEEYCYGVGQAVSYILSLSKAKNKTDAFINPYLNAQSVSVIRRKLLQLYKKYNYCIAHTNNGREKQLLSHLIVYDPKEIKAEYIMAGFTARSLIYEKSEK